MKKPVFILLGCVMLGGCASTGYWGNRRQDALDMFTLSTGAGFGAKARLGPVGAGLLTDTTEGGLRGGQWLTDRVFANLGNPVPWNHDLQFLLVGEEQFLGGITALARGKAYSAVNVLGLNIPHPKDLSKEARAQADHLLQPYPLIEQPGYANYLGQCEVVVGLGLSLRVGFNVSEFIDFLLGWFTLDPLRDDPYGPPITPPVPPEGRKITSPETGRDIPADVRPKKVKVIHGRR